MRQTNEDSLTLAHEAVRWVLDKKGLEPLLLDVRELCSYADYLLIASGRSARQVEAIADSVSRGLKRLGYRLLGSEGTQEGRWVLLDYGDIVVHLFEEGTRMFYDLESLWSDAPRVALPADLAAAAESASQ